MELVIPDEWSNCLADKDKNGSAFEPYRGHLRLFLIAFTNGLGISSPKKLLGVFCFELSNFTTL